MLHLLFIFIGILAVCLTSFPSISTPAQVIIVRHGEKPLSGEILSLKGEIRAAALAPYFAGTHELLLFGKPVVAYANRPSTEGSSLKPIETIIPTIQSLKIPLNTKYRRNEFPEMVHEVLTSPQYNGKNILICWEHSVIPNMAHSFGVTPIPSAWPDDVYDRTFIIRFNKDGTVKNFHNLPQALLFGDSRQ